MGTEKELEEYLSSTVQTIARNSKVAISLAKRLINSNITSKLQVSNDKDSLASSVCLASGDTQKRLEDFFQKRKKN